MTMGDETKPDNRAELFDMQVEVPNGVLSERRAKELRQARFARYLSERFGCCV